MSNDYREDIVRRHRERVLKGDLHCATCLYFDERDQGECHRQPPQTLVKEHESWQGTVAIAIWPRVDPQDDWCGDWEPD